MKQQYNRRSIRLPRYNYSSYGYYFVTICTHDRYELFGKIVGATRGSSLIRRRPGSIQIQMVLNKYGKIVENIWTTLPDHHAVKLDEYQIMPNHIHFIIVLLGGPKLGGSRPAPTTLGTVVGLLKSECTKQIRREMGNLDKIVWQRNYYENVIRDEQSLNKTRQYIKNNPINWKFDRNNPKNPG